MIDEDWDAMSMEDIAEYFIDKNFFEKTSCNCQKWNRMMTRIVKKYGDGTFINYGDTPKDVQSEYFELKDNQETWSTWKVENPSFFQKEEV